MTLARLVRGQMLSLKERDYVIAARAMGAPQWRIVFTHMLPNTLGPVIVAIVFGIPLAIFAEAALGFIGFSVPAADGQPRHGWSPTATRYIETHVLAGRSSRRRPSPC